MKNKERVIWILIVVIFIIISGKLLSCIDKDDEQAIKNCIKSGYSYNSCMKGLGY